MNKDIRLPRCLMLAALLCLPLLQPSATAQAQLRSWEAALYEVMGAEDVTDEAIEQAYDLLCELEAQPLNINRITREELEQLPFLTAQQVEGIVEYVYHYGPLKSLGELQMVTALDARRRLLLEHFVALGEGPEMRRWPSAADIARYGHSELTATGHIPAYNRRGDDNGYLGYKYKHWVKYQFSYADRLRFGLTGSQDAGEPFFTSRNRLGYDHYSYYIQLRHVGRLEALNLGMYRLQLGMGLTLNTHFLLGKQATLQSLGRSTSSLRAHSSRSAAGYLQGAAAIVRLSDHWRLTAFASYRPVDATLNDDGTVRTLLTDGYHRTPTEMEKKNNTHQTAAGGALAWRRGRWNAGINAVYLYQDRDLKPQKANTPYRRYAAEGNHFLNVSASYGYVDHRWALSGETAVNRDGAIAAIHSASLTATETLSLMALHRYYDKRYTALLGQSFGENTSVSNEHGLYVGATWQPRRTWQLQWYADYAHFPYLRYGISMPSDAFDTMLAAQYAAGRWTLGGRYRLHIRQHDDERHVYVINRTEHRARLSATYAASSQWLLRMQADGCASYYRQSEHGWMVSARGEWRGRWLRGSGTVGYFHTDSYETRIYQYEPTVLYNFSFPMYYGEGIRYALLLRADIGRWAMVTAKVGITDYFDRDAISSGLQRIDGSSACDVDVQLRIRF